MAGKADRSVFLGLDTSAYTTSLALVDREERLIWERRLPLPVREGGLGLRPAEAVFNHLLNLPRLWADGAGQIGTAHLAVVAASVRPRPREDSYMPVFKVGEAFAAFAAQTAGLIFLPSSHQEGHIMAGLWSAGLPPARYLVLHLSGGTTELLSAVETAPGELAITLHGGTADINAGQFVDRIGVAMSLAFPAGPALERLARDGNTGAVVLPVAQKGLEISFSGPDSHARRLLERGCSRADLARAVEVCIAESLVRAIKALGGLPRYRALLLVGGVAANSFIRDYIKQSLPELPLYYASPEYSGDNAVGLAVQAARKFKTGGL